MSLQLHEHVYWLRTPSSVDTNELNRHVESPFGRQRSSFEENTIDGIDGFDSRRKLSREHSPLHSLLSAAVKLSPTVANRRHPSLERLLDVRMCGIQVVNSLMTRRQPIHCRHR